MNKRPKPSTIQNRRASLPRPGVTKEARPITGLHLPASITPLDPTPEFLAAAESLGIQFDPGDTRRLGLYLALLLHANNTCNLTAITDPSEAWMKHILDSLTLLPMLADLAPASEGAQPRIIDIGSGGGVPGLPLAIVLPAHQFTLLEATGKKTDFLRAAAPALNLSNVTIIQGRAEELGQEHKTHRERYDAATARALGHLAIVTELAAPLVRPGGLILAIKGAKADAELAEASKAMGLVGARHVTTTQTPTGRIVILEKTTRTPRTYPRRNGEPKRAPLGLSK
jgi:16S rRNA (guanine527-N7)-methyltransferase